MPKNQEIKPLVSVIVLNYNGGEIIGECLEKLIDQTYQNIEILVVDNNSSDSSIEIINKYLQKYKKVRLVKSNKNLGCPGGRNLGLKYAKGEIIAFIDNDGFADRDWVKNAVKALSGGSEIGAVASTVFFYSRKNILNGAGGKMNKSGYGKDICFNEPIEFADLPNEVLFAMGCGLICKREVMDLVGDFDAPLFNYYDDVDLCIKIWKCGYKIILAKEAYIWHKFSYTDSFNNNKHLLFERNRIRIVLKHFPIRLLLSWIGKEIYHEYVNRHFLGIFVKGWIWNIKNLQTLYKERTSYRKGDNGYLRFIENQWGPIAGEPNNMKFEPEIEKTGKTLLIGSRDESHYLNHGWYKLEKDTINGVSYRWSYKIASLIFRIPDKSTEIILKYSPSSGIENIEVVIRDYHDLKENKTFNISNPGKQHEWYEYRVDVSLTKGDYEIIFKVNKLKENQERSNMPIGIALSSVTFA